MTTYGTVDGTFTYGAAPMTVHVVGTMPSVDQENELDDATCLGSPIEREIYTGLAKYGHVTVGGPYDSAAGGCELVFGAAARARTYASLAIGWGGTKTTTFSAVGVAKYSRKMDKGKVLAYECELFQGPGCIVTEV